jgi:ABC-2 type transport system ATP-binding protein
MSGLGAAGASVAGAALDPVPDVAAWGLRDVSVRHAGIAWLDHVDLAVRPGEVTAVVGGDGAGKSTLLRVLAGAVPPTSGEVRRPRAREIGFMSAGPGIYVDLTVAENLGFAGAAYGLSRAQVAERSGQLLERIGLASTRDRLTGKLSGGMRHKLAFATAVMHRPRLLILDEPTTGVDPVSRAEIWRLIAGQAAAGAAIVISTKYLDEAERAGQIVVLLDGRSLLVGAPGAVVAAMPGRLVASASRLDRDRSWRRGSVWRTWLPGGEIPPPVAPGPDGAIPGQVELVPDLEDAAVVAELAARLGRPAAEGRLR